MFDTDEKIDLHLIKSMQAAPQASGNTPQPQELNGRFYRIAPICAYCGQPCSDDDLMTSVRDSDGNDLPAHKDCAVEVMKGTWDLLVSEGKGNTEPFPGQLFADESQITPYVAVDLDKIVPLDKLDRHFVTTPQQVHTTGRKDAS